MKDLEPWTPMQAIVFLVVMIPFAAPAIWSILK